AAHAAVGRLEADHAAGGGRQADRAAGVRAERAVDETRGDRRARAARRPAGDVRRIEWIAAVAEVLVMACRPRGELRHVEGAGVGGAGLVEGREPRRGEAGAPSAADFRAAGRDAPGAIEHILMRERYAVQRAAHASARKLRIKRRGLLERALRV